jgi:hydrogenase/urease accessory protein HupE
MFLRFCTHVITALGLLACSLVSSADDLRPGYLEMRQVDAETYDVFWKVPARGEDLRLGLYVVFPEGSSNVTEPVGGFRGGAFSERWRVTRPGGMLGQTVRIDGLSAMVTDVIVRIERSDGTTQVLRLLPANPEFVIEASAGSAEVAETYLGLGVLHILTGVDHLLFVLALLLIVNGVARVVWTVTAFTVAHSITLAAASLGWVHIPGPPVEAAIALSIVFVAAEIVHGLQGRPGLTARWPWVVAFTFGLLHGFGFAGVLGEIGLPQNAIPLALLFFNLGVELGQLLFVGCCALAALLLRRSHWPRWAELAPAYVIGTVGMYWVVERVAGFAGG